MYTLTNQSLLLSLQRGILAAKTAPSFITEIKDQRAAVGESIKFTCKFAGTPRPGIYNTIPRYMKLCRNLLKTQIQFSNEKLKF